ncbi:MAG: type II toxin-antitoxin system HicB family antitoxin [Candidatus Thermoplasmatota archaeon]|nr:type II toxin-antitoxin system HicB family antitoxin [Candidatus Thermoplasmatota archaeon]
MKIYEFKVLLEPDESGGYVVTCPSLPGCYTQGETVEDALKNIEEAILLCLEDMESHGEKIPDTSKSLIGTVIISE